MKYLFKIIFLILFSTQIFSQSGNTIYISPEGSDDNDGSHIWMRNLIAESFEQVSALKP